MLGCNLFFLYTALKGQSHQDLVLLQNPMEVLQLIEKFTLLTRTVVVTKVVQNWYGYGRVGKKWSKI